MLFETIDNWARLLSPEQQIKLSMSRLINLAYMEIVPISAMHFAPNLFKIAQDHHALDLYVYDNYEYDTNHITNHSIKLIVRFNAKTDYNQNDIAWFSNLASNFNLELVVQEGIVQ